MSRSTLVWTKQVIAEPADVDAGNVSGHRLVMTITEASLVGTKPFIFQRAPVTPGDADYEDAFYSVATVVDMADLAEDAPATGSVFYRTNTIDLHFPHLDELNDAIIDIEAALGRLALNNDLSLDLEDATTSSFPADSVERYWGMSADATVTDEQILAFSHEPGTTLPFEKTFDTDDTTVYLYFVYRASLGAGTFLLNGSSVATTLVTRAVVNAHGHSASYRIYRTTATQNGSVLTLAVS